MDKLESIESDMERVVSSALDRGVTPKEFIELASAMWDHVLARKQSYDASEWDRALKRK